MAKRKTTIRMRTYGIHTKWESGSKKLPRLVEATTDVPAQIDIEFGFVVNIQGAKNRQLDFCIDHPGILDAAGSRRPPFDGSVYVKQNDWDFYLGDTVWEPIIDKLGRWHMWIALDGKVIAEKTFHLYDPSLAESSDEVDELSY